MEDQARLEREIRRQVEKEAEIKRKAEDSLAEFIGDVQRKGLLDAWDSGPRCIPAGWWCVHSPPCQDAVEAEANSVHHHRSVFRWLMVLKVKFHNCAPWRKRGEGEYRRSLLSLLESAREGPK